MKLYRLVGGLKLAVVQVRIKPAFGQQFFVGALLHDVAFVEHQDAVRIPDGGKAVGDDKAGAALRSAGSHGLLDEHSPVRVSTEEVASSEDQHRGVGFEDGPGNGQQLLLAVGDVAGLFVDSSKS